MPDLSIKVLDFSDFRKDIGEHTSLSNKPGISFGLRMILEMIS